MIDLPDNSTINVTGVQITLNVTVPAEFVGEFTNRLCDAITGLMAGLHKKEDA